MTSANERWTAWMAKHWPNADDEWQRLLWAFWCEAIRVGRTMEREPEDETKTMAKPEVHLRTHLVEGWAEPVYEVSCHRVWVSRSTYKRDEVTSSPEGTG